MKQVKIYFQVITPESAENGDFSELGEHDLRNVETIEDALDVAASYGYLEPSSSCFHSEIWYSTIDPECNYKTGAETYYTIHLDGFSEQEQREFYSKISKVC